MTPMFTVTVVPISRGSGISELTYYSSVAYPQGSFIYVPVRNTERLALVLRCDEVKKVKATLRNKSFALKKVRKQKSRQLVTQEFVRAVEKVAQKHAASVGAVLFSVIPKVLIELAESVGETEEITKPKLRGYIVPRLYQGLAKSRTEFYKTSIREAFAAGGSVFLMVPTIADGERVYKELCGGIEKYSYFLHRGVPKKKQQSIVEDVLQSEHPVLLIAPFQYLSLPRHDLVTVIVEREGSPLYRSRTRPFVDARTLAHEVAAEIGGQLFLADLPLRIESVHMRSLGEYEEIVTGDHRMHFPTKAEILNLQGSGTSEKKRFRVLDRELFDKIRDTGLHGGRTFLYVARRGLSPVTLCQDCGTVVKCAECGVSVVLHRGGGENHFLCHSCGALRHARERCSYCSSWRLGAFGIGTELVEQEVQETLPKREVFVISSDTVKTHKQADAVVKQFYNTPKSILVGTEMALPYLTKHVPLVGVASLDSLLSLASWNIYERIAATLTRLREIAGEELVVQTRCPEADVLRTVVAGNFSGFYKSELEMRKTLGYPRYTVLVKVSYTGKQEVVEQKIEEAVEHLKPYELIPFSRFLQVPGGKYMLHGFLRVERETWPDDELIARLRSLSPSYQVSVDPDSIL